MIQKKGAPRSETEEEEEYAKFQREHQHLILGCVRLFYLESVRESTSVILFCLFRLTESFSWDSSRLTVDPHSPCRLSD